MSRKSVDDAPTTPTPPALAYARTTRSGKARSLPITAGDQGDPKGDTAPPDAGNNDGFTLASSASGPRTTPTCQAVVVEGTPLQQVNTFAGGSYPSSEDEEDSPPLLDLPPVLERFASAASPTMTAASDPDPVEARLEAMSESERRRTGAFDSEFAALGGRYSRLEQRLSDIDGDLSKLSAESNALIQLNTSNRHGIGDIHKNTQTIADTMAEFLRTVAASDTKHRLAFEASEARNRQALADYRTSLEQSLKEVTTVHAKSMDAMDKRVQGSFDRMKYLEKTFAGVPERFTNHLDARLPAILTEVVGTAITPALTAVLEESLPRTVTDALEGPLADLRTQLRADGGGTSTLRMQELADAQKTDHTEVMTAIEDLGRRISALDDVVASPAVPRPVANPTPTPPPTTTRAPGSGNMPVRDSNWGCNFEPSSPPAPPAHPPPSTPSLGHGLRVETVHPGVPGGRIKTPRSFDPARRAREMKTNRFDLAGLADAGYHWGVDGVDDLDERIISNCGYQSFHVDHPADILLCFQEIINLHKIVVRTWTNTRTHFSGPVVEYILEKALPVFPRLHDLDVAGTVKFYDGLQKISMRYLLPLMPFDSISLAFGYEGLCPPGLGTGRYSAIASAWMDVLPRLLPQRESVVESAIFSVGVDSNNGFDLMWRILELAVPGFKSMNPVQVPTWTPQTDVLSFCREHLLYFRLQSKHNMFFSPRTQTNIFLGNIQRSEYADVVTTLQSQVNAYLADDDDGFLPANLRINGIATAIHMNASARARDVGLASPRVRRVAGEWDPTSWPPVPEDELPLCGVQGYQPRACRVDQGQDRFRRPYERDSPAGRGGRGPDRDRAGRGRREFNRDAQRPSPRDRSIRPDLRRRSFLPGVQCRACRRIGHEAASCDMLAIALFLNRYIKSSLPDDSRQTIESAWVARWKEKLGQPQRSPSQVMKAYCDDLDITAGHLDQAMDWDCWPEDEYGDFAQDLQLERD